MVDRVIAVAMGIVTLAALAVIVSKRSNTAKVLTSLLTGFQGTIKAAVSPIK